MNQTYDSLTAQIRFLINQAEAALKDAQVWEAEGYHAEAIRSLNRAAAVRETMLRLRKRREALEAAGG